MPSGVVHRDDRPAAASAASGRYHRRSCSWSLDGSFVLAEPVHRRQQHLAVAGQALVPFAPRSREGADDGARSPSPKFRSAEPPRGRAHRAAALAAGRAQPVEARSRATRPSRRHGVGLHVHEGRARASAARPLVGMSIRVSGVDRLRGLPSSSTVKSSRPRSRTGWSFRSVTIASTPRRIRPRPRRRSPEAAASKVAGWPAPAPGSGGGRTAIRRTAAVSIGASSRGPFPRGESPACPTAESRAPARRCPRPSRPPWRPRSSLPFRQSASVGSPKTPDGETWPVVLATLRVSGPRADEPVRHRPLHAHRRRRQVQHGRGLQLVRVRSALLLPHRVFGAACCPRR